MLLFDMNAMGLIKRFAATDYHRIAQPLEWGDYWDHKDVGGIFVGSSSSTPRRNGKGNDIQVNPDEVGAR
jgi:hypothetical protein